MNPRLSPHTDSRREGAGERQGAGPSVPHAEATVASVRYPWNTASTGAISFNVRFGSQEN